MHLKSSNPSVTLIIVGELDYGRLMRLAPCALGLSPVAVQRPPATVVPFSRLESPELPRTNNCGQ